MKKVLIVETNITKYGESNEPTGLWLGEATEFIDELNQADISYDFVSPLGGFVPLDPRGMQYVDSNIMSIYGSKDYQLRGLSQTLSPNQIDADEYSAIYYTGGHGVMWDFTDNHEMQNIAKNIYNQGGYITSVCHGIAGILNIKDDTGNYIINGKKITGFTAEEENLAGKSSIVPFFNQNVAETNGAIFKQETAYKDYVVVDGQLITGQNPFSVRSVAKALIAQLTE